MEHSNNKYFNVNDKISLIKVNIKCGESSQIDALTKTDIILSSKIGEGYSVVSTKGQTSIVEKIYNEIKCSSTGNVVGICFETSTSHYLALKK